ncbi:MAG: branched chain amino acid aminotransferase [Novosphingobium sp.]|nr:branched chain amino acid aminotransferase [Novosphingobium sp.]
MATLADSATRFARTPHPAPTPAAVRDEVLANPGFGTRFTDHMVSIDWSEEAGWHNPEVLPYGPIALDPAASVLHYAQEIFEGLKAYRHPDGSMALFRPQANAKRFNASARRLAMPELPEKLFIAAIREMVAADKDWFPTVEGGSLYLRPFMIATEAFLGVRAAKSYRFLVIASPAGNYFKSGAPAVSLWVSDYTRAAPGGTGAAKCGGNYAASLVPTAEAFAKGHDQVLFLDASEHKWIEELGGMNVFFAFADGSLLTPALSGTILEGVTRDSLIALARDEGLTVREDKYSLDQWRTDAASGQLVEAFACGTAAVVTPIGKVAGHDGEFTIGSGGPGQLTGKLKARLTAIQRGEAPDPHGWVMRIG